MRHQVSVVMHKCPLWDLYLAHSLWSEGSFLSIWLHNICLYNSPHSTVCKDPPTHSERLILGPSLGLTRSFHREKKKNTQTKTKHPSTTQSESFTVRSSSVLVFRFAICFSMTNSRSSGLNVIIFSGVTLLGDML